MPMPLSNLSTKQLHGAILYGCQLVINQRENLNLINVFPVADGDTGDNMASTATAIISYSSSEDSIDKTLQSIADASVMGARGNSGMIFSQFFNALSEKALNKDQLNLHDFHDLLNEAAKGVRQALSSPVEGTMLTIIDAWAKIMACSSEQIECFKTKIQAILPNLRAVVDDTTQHLSALKNAHVVDAGALGFYHFIQGFSDFLSNPEQLILPEKLPDQINVAHDIPTVETPPERRYCTEAIVRAEQLDKAELAKELAEHGDSVVLTGNQRICRFHVHSNKPWEIFAKLLNKGTIDSPKVDDMTRQFEIIHKRKHSIALVADSSADLPMALKDEYQIHLIPLNIHLDDHRLLDRYCFDSEDFYETLKTLKGYPKTSFPTPLLIEEKLKYLAQHYEHVLVLPLSQALSGTYDAFALAAQNIPNVHVINSCLTTGALGLVMNYAAELIAQGMDIERLKKAVQKAIDSTYIYVMVDQFDSLVRSGRINKFVGRLANFSGIKPIITLDKQGKGTIHGKAFSTNSALAKLVSYVQELQQKTGKSIKRYCIVHAGAPERAKEFSQLTTEALNQPPAYIELVSAAIGLHGGHGCVAIAVMLDPTLED